MKKIILPFLFCFFRAFAAPAPVPDQIRDSLVAHGLTAAALPGLHHVCTSAAGVLTTNLCGSDSGGGVDTLFVIQTASDTAHAVVSNGLNAASFKTGAFSGAVTINSVAGDAVYIHNIANANQTDIAIDNTNGRYRAGVLASGGAFTGSMTAGGTLSLYSNNVVNGLLGIDGSFTVTGGFYNNKSASNTISVANADAYLADRILGSGILLQQTLSSPYTYVIQTSNDDGSFHAPLCVNCSGGNMTLGNSGATVAIPGLTSGGAASYTGRVVSSSVGDNPSTNSAFAAISSQPSISYRETDAASNTKEWTRAIEGGCSYDEINNDAHTSGVYWQIVCRTGMTVDSVVMQASKIGFDGSTYATAAYMNNHLIATRTYVDSLTGGVSRAYVDDSLFSSAHVCALCADPDAGTVAGWTTGDGGANTTQWNKTAGDTLISKPYLDSLVSVNLGYYATKTWVDSQGFATVTGVDSTLSGLYYVNGAANVDGVMAWFSNVGGSPYIGRLEKTAGDTIATKEYLQGAISGRMQWDTTWQAFTDYYRGQAVAAPAGADPSVAGYTFVCGQDTCPGASGLDAAPGWSRMGASAEDTSVTVYLSGCASGGSGMAKISRVGHSVSLSIPALTCTSSSTTGIISGIPEHYWPGDVATSGMLYVQDNGVNGFGYAEYQTDGTIVLSHSLASLVTGGSGSPGSNFTDDAPKGVQAFTMTAVK